MSSGGGTEETTVAAAASDWERHVDDASGATYFYNRASGESSWVEPEGFVAAAEEDQHSQKAGANPPRWRRFTDDDSGKTYFYDEANDVTQWEEPEGLVVSDGASSGEDDEEEQEEEQPKPGEDAKESDTDEGREAERKGDADTTREQNDEAKTTETASTDAKALAPSSSTGAASSTGWAKYVDAATGKPYFYNAGTRVTQWEPPSEYQDAAPAVSAEYQAHLVRVQTERLARVTQQALDPTGNLSKLNAILSGIGGSAAESVAGPDGEGGEAEASREKPEWQQHVDPQTQRYYYYNVVTGVTQWQKPDAPVASGLADWIPPEIPEEKSANSKTVSGINYVARAKFNRLTGKYEQLDSEAYWQRVGAPNDRAGRQMSHFFDMSALEQNREEARRKAEALKRKNINWKKIAAEKKAKKLKQKNEWIYTD